MSAVKVRAATAKDLEFVVSSWVDSYRMSHFAGPLPMPLYRELMTPAVRWILARPGIEVLVAYKPGETPPDDVYGWACVESDVPMRVREFDPAQRQTVEVERPAPQRVVHYLYVKQTFREHGIAKRLLATAGVDPRLPFAHTFKTAVLVKLLQRGAAPGAFFAPVLCRFPKIETKHEPNEEYR